MVYKNELNVILQTYNNIAVILVLKENFQLNTNLHSKAKIFLDIFLYSICHRFW